MKVKGVNLGNWLVLEKWMSPALFAGTTAEDEYYLPRQLSKEVYEARIKIHRSEYITERDFVTIKAKGMEAVRIPVPYFIFGDREPFLGCIEELDKAFCWAKRYDLKVLIDLHTAPLGQNGFELKAWKDFMQEEKYKNVVLDTHQYIMLAEQNVEAYKTYVKEHFKKEIQEMEAYFPVICGEWCLFNSLACGWDSWDFGRCADFGWFPEV